MTQRRPTIPGLLSFEPRTRLGSRHRHGGLTKTVAIAAGGQRLRVARWHGCSDTALVAPSRPGRSLGRSDVERCVTLLNRAGVKQAFTPALNWLEAEPFFQAGFEVHENLYLLAHTLHGLSPRSPHRVRRARRVHQTQVLALDNLAFDGFWRFDRAALKEARRATPYSRYTVAVAGDEVAGYAITGQARNRGYLQRLAVHPRHQGQGLATALVHDGFDWLWRRQSRMVMVNTQHQNRKALELYERLGFQREREGLVVLAWRGQP